METDMPSTSTSSQPTSSEASLDHGAMSQTTKITTQPPQSPDMNYDTLTKDDGMVKKNVVPDLPSLCFPLINAASLQPIDLSRPLPVSHLVTQSSDSHDTEDGENYALLWNQLRTSHGSFTAHSRHKLRMARKEIFYKLGLRRHWCDERKLIAAVQSSEPSRVRQMLDDGANPNVCDQKLRTSLHIAASQGQDYVASLLLAKRADPNRQDILGNTPLHLAVCRGDRSTVKILIENGANIFAKDNNGRTPLSLVKSRLGTLRRDQNLTTDRLKSEFMLISDFLHAQAKLKMMPSETSMDDLCQMMQTVSTREQADEIADAVFQKMSDMSIENADKSKSAKPVSSFHAIL